MFFSNNEGRQVIIKILKDRLASVKSKVVNVITEPFSKKRGKQH